MLNPESLIAIDTFKDIMGYRKPRIKNYRQRLVAGRKKGQDTLESLQNNLEDSNIQIEQAKKDLIARKPPYDYDYLLSKLQDLLRGQRNIKLLIWCYTHNVWLGTCVSSANIRVFIKSITIDQTGTIQLGYQDIKNIKGSISIHLDQPLPFKVR